MFKVWDGIYTLPCFKLKHIGQFPIRKQCQDEGDGRLAILPYNGSSVEAEKAVKQRNICPWSG